MTGLFESAAQPMIDKAGRLVVGDRVRKLHERIYVVRGDTGTYLVAVANVDEALALGARGWAVCSCPAPHGCSHILAASKVMFDEAGEAAHAASEGFASTRPVAPGVVSPRASREQGGSDEGLTSDAARPAAGGQLPLPPPACHAGGASRRASELHAHAVSGTAQPPSSGGAASSGAPMGDGAALAVSAGVVPHGMASADSVASPRPPARARSSVAELRDVAPVTSVRFRARPSRDDGRGSAG